MKGFIGNLISRHVSPANKVAPRLASRFENYTSFFQNAQENTNAYNEKPLNKDLPPQNIEPKTEEQPVKQKKDDTIEVNFSIKNIGREIERKIDDTSDLTRKTQDKEVQNIDTNFTPTNKLKPQSVLLQFEKQSAGKQKASDTLITDDKANTRIMPQSFKPNNFIEPSENSTIEKSYLISESQHITRLLTAEGKNVQDGDLIMPANAESKKVLPFNGQNSSSTPGLGEPVKQTIIKVNIGRIEIQAINEPASNVVAMKNNATSSPKTSLDDYLKKRNGK